MRRETILKMAREILLQRSCDFGEDANEARERGEDDEEIDRLERLDLACTRGVLHLDTQLQEVAS